MRPGVGARFVGPIVVGGGVAGLSTALALGDCTVVTSAALGAGGSSPLAQGGVAAAVSPRDEPEAHAADTLSVAGGLAEPTTVEIVTDGASAAIEQLASLGMAFDRSSDGTLALGREAGHSTRRILHANGDATGAAIMNALTAAIRARPDIEVLEGTEAIDLVVGDRGVAGVVVATKLDGRLAGLLGSAVVLATGGYAHCFVRTTTPAEVIGSGLAMAARAGARVADVEFVQFHPTALDIEGDSPLPLLTEALRGEGATLINDTGHRYMVGEHPDAELAPRDIVARANYRQLMAGRRPCLDARSSIGANFPTRFPTVFALTQSHGFDPRAEPLPVTPAAHYCMGGVAVDDFGQTSLRGLWAVGETSSSGLHGANRLASNSLLEGLVMGRRVASAVRASPDVDRLDRPTSYRIPADLARLDHLSVGWADEGNELVGELRQLLWSGAGVVREETGLRRVLAELDAVAGEAERNLRSRIVHTVAKMVATAALIRTESRGAHYRADFPLSDPNQARRRFVYSEPVSWARWKPDLDSRRQLTPATR